MNEVAVFAGGCFWCIQDRFDKINGVLETIVGYTGGKLNKPTYEKVSLGLSGHSEAIKIVFNPSKVSYRELLIEFLSIIDPTDEFGQFCDIGLQYEPKIFYLNEKQKIIASKAIEILNSSGIFEKTITVKLEKFKSFYEAEGYHQKYYLKQPKIYKFYFEHSGRIAYYKKMSNKVKQFLENRLK